MSKRLFSTRRYLHKRNELITPPATRKGRREWIISRGLCYYRLFSLHDIPAARRESVLQLQIKQWSPFREYDRYCVWQGGQVQVWIWDKPQQQDMLTDVGIKQAAVMPETVLYTRQTTDTVLLVQCLEGVEGQVWKNGLLVGSRWWAQVPESREWINFQRMHSLPANDNIPPALEEPLLERPWRQKKNYVSHLNVFQEPLLVILGAAVFTILLSWQITHIWIWQQALGQVQTQVDKLQDSITPILTARTQALENKKHFENLLTFNPYSSQLEILTLVAEKLPPRQEAKILEWFYQLGELRFILEVKKIDPAFYINTFQTQPLFTEIKTKTGKGKKSNRISISMKLSKQN